MDYRTLRYILTVAEEQNISKAAQRLYISQPSLSHCILKQERLLGVTLFDRAKQPLQLTYAGQRYVEAARQILSTKEELEKEMEDIANTKKGRIMLGVTRPRSAYLLPLILPRFKVLYPNVELVLLEENASYLESLLITGKADIAILVEPVQSEHLAYVHFYDEEILLCLPENHLMTEKFAQEGVDLKLLKEESFILYKVGQRVRKVSDQLFAEAGFKPKIILESQVAETIMGLVGVNMGCAFLPKSVFKYCGISGGSIAFTLGHPPVHSSFTFAWRKDRYISWAAQEFIKEARDFIEGENRLELEIRKHTDSEVRFYARNLKKDFRPE